jgi:hypothetical protein
MQDNVVHLTNDARTCDAVDTRLTREGSLKVLKRLADQVENGNPALKGSRSFYLRKLFRDFNAGKSDVSN